MTSESRSLTIGCWSFAVVPDDWERIEGHGIRRTGEGVFPSNVVVVEEPLREDLTLQQYVEAQMSLFRMHLADLELDGPGLVAVRGAEDALELVIRYTSEGGQAVVQRQIYARYGQVVGVVTFTTVMNELSQLRPVFDRIRGGLSFSPMTL